MQNSFQHLIQKLKSHPFELLKKRFLPLVEMTKNQIQKEQRDPEMNSR